jgi:hypothetical protein
MIYEVKAARRPSRGHECQQPGVVRAACLVKGSTLFVGAYLDAAEGATLALLYHVPEHDSQPSWRRGCRRLT